MNIFRIGNYIVTSFKDLKSNNKYQMILNDYMCKLNKDYIDNNTYPITLWNFYKNFANFYGVEVVEQKDLPNRDFMIYTPPVFEGTSGRIVLSRIAEMFGSFAKFNRENKLQMYLKTETNEEIKFTDMNTNLEINDIPNRINGVSLELGNGVEGENVVKKEENISKDEEHFIRIVDNPFVYTQELREQAIEGLYQRLDGFSFTPCKLQYKGRFYYDCGDEIKVQDCKTKKFYKTIVMNQYFEIPATRQSTIENEALTKTGIEYQYETKDKQANRKVELAVKKHEGIIEALVEENTEQNTKISQIEQTAEKIEESVSMVADLTNTVTGIQKVELPKAMNGNALNFKILGNNTVLGGELLTEREEALLNLQLISYSNNKQPYTKYIYNHNAQGFVPTNVLIYSIKPNTTYTVNLKNIVDYGRNEITVGTSDKYLPDITETTTLNNFISNFSYKYNEDSNSYYWDIESNKYWYTIKSGENDSYLYITYKNESFKSNLEVWESISKLLVTSADLKEKFKIEHVKAYLGYYYTYQNDTVTSYTPKIYPNTDTKRFYILELEVGKTYNIFLDENEISDSLWLYIATFKENPFKSEVTEEIEGIKYYGIRRTKKNDSGDWVGYTNLEERHITITASEDEKYLIFYPSSNSTFDTANIYDYYREIKLNYGIALKQKEGIFDEYEIDNSISKVIHRLGTNQNGEIYELSKEYEEILGELPIELTKETNILSLSESAKLSVKYIIINDLTNNFTSSTQFKSIIQLLYNSILLQVAQKVGDEEIIAKLNIAIKDGEGIIDILGNKIKIKSDYFELTENGIITATGGKIAGFTIGDKVLESDLVGMAQGEQKAFWVRQTKNGQDIFLVTMSGDVSCKTILVDGNPLVRTTPQAGREIRNLYIDGNQLVAITSDGLYIILPDSVPSDKRLKTDIKDSNQKVLDVIDKIKFRDFKWKETGEIEKTSLVADELQEVARDLVSEVEGGKFEKTKVVNKSKLIYYNTKAIQELSAEIKKRDVIMNKQTKIINYLIDKLECREELKNLKLKIGE